MAVVSTLVQAYADVDDFLDHGTDGLDQLLLDAGWERSSLGEELSAAAGLQDRVYYSTGEDSKKRLWLRVTHEGATDRVHFRTYSFWAAGTPGIGYNVAGNVAGATCLQLVDGAMTGWLVASKDGVSVVVDIGGATYNKGYFGAYTRQSPSQLDFTGSLSGQTTTANKTGDSVLFFQVGTDFSNLEANQYLWVVNQSTTSGPANVERVQVASFNSVARTINLVAPLTEDYDTGAIVSVDPQPMVLWGSSVGTLIGSTPYALHGTAAYNGALLHPLGNTSYLDAIGATAIPSSSNGLIPLAELILYSDAGGDRDVQGVLPRLLRAATGTLLDLDDVEVGSATYRAFTDGTRTVALLEA